MSSLLEIDFFNNLVPLTSRCWNDSKENLFEHLTPGYITRGVFRTLSSIYDGDFLRK